MAGIKKVHIAPPVIPKRPAPNTLAGRRMSGMTDTGPKAPSDPIADILSHVPTPGAGAQKDPTAHTPQSPADVREQLNAGRLANRDSVVNNPRKTPIAPPATSVQSAPLKPYADLDEKWEDVFDLADSKAAHGLGTGISPDFNPEPAKPEDRDYVPPNPLWTLARHLSVARLSDAVSRAVTRGDQITLDNLVNDDNFFLSLNFEDIKRAYAKGIKDSGDSRLANKFLKTNFPRGGSAELEKTLTTLYGTDDPMHDAFADTPPSTAPSLGAEEIARLATARPPIAPTPEALLEDNAFGPMSSAEALARMRDIDDAIKKQRDPGVRLVDPAQLEQEARAGTLSSALTDSGLLTRILAEKKFTPAEVHVAIDARSDISPKDKAILRARVDIFEESLNIRGVPEKGNIRKFFEWYGEPAKSPKDFVAKVAVGAGIAVAGSGAVLSGLAFAGIGASVLSFWAVPAILVRGTAGATASQIASWMLRKSEKGPIAKAVIKGISALLAGGLTQAAMNNWDSLLSLIRSPNPESSYDLSTVYPPPPTPPTDVPPPSPAPAPVPAPEPAVPPAPSDTAPPNWETEVKPYIETPAPVPGADGTPSEPAPTIYIDPVGDHYVVPENSIVGKLGLWGSFTEEILRNKDSFLAQVLSKNGIVLASNLQESFAMAINEVLYKNPDLLAALSPDVIIEETADGFKSIVHEGDAFSGTTMEESWKNLFSNNSFRDKLFALVGEGSNYKSLAAALVKKS